MGCSQDNRLYFSIDILLCVVLSCCVRPCITERSDAMCVTVLECVSRAGLYVSASDHGDRSFSLALYNKAVELDPSSKVSGIVPETSTSLHLFPRLTCVVPAHTLQDAWLGIGAILQDRGDLIGSSRAFSNAMSVDPWYHHHTSGSRLTFALQKP